MIQPDSDEECVGVCAGLFIQRCVLYVQTKIRKISSTHHIKSPFHDINMPFRRKATSGFFFVIVRLEL